MMQLTHPKVAQPKSVAFRTQNRHGTLTIRHGCQTVRWKASARSTVGNRAIFNERPTNCIVAFWHDKFCSFWICFFILFVPYFFSFVEYHIVREALICLPIKKLMDFLVFRRGVLCDSLKSSLGRKKTCIFSFWWEHAFSPIFTVCTILSANPFDWGWYGGVLYGLHPIFSNYK